jgi:hypothetical protein
VVRPVWSSEQRPAPTITRPSLSRRESWWRVFARCCAAPAAPGRATGTAGLGPLRIDDARHIDTVEIVRQRYARGEISCDEHL